MTQLINNADVRKYRQLGKQTDTTNFDGHVKTIQENELTELLGEELSYDLFNFLNNGFTDVAETYEFINVNSFKILNSDKTLLINCSLKINNTIFVKVSDAYLDDADTIIEVIGYDLSNTISSVAYSTETKYMNLVNGIVYIKNGNPINFKGLRPFLIWNLLVSYLVDGSLKQSDVGNFQILSDTFQKSNNNDIKIAKSEYLQNATREGNKIIAFLSNNTNIYTLYNNNTDKQNISDFDFFIV
jgi:hypothetical protein